MTDNVLLPPVWLLDVDGVLNAVAEKPDPSVWPRGEWVRGFARAGRETWPILASEAVLAFVRDVHERGLAEVRWHTTWGEWARGELTDLLGLPDFPVQCSRVAEGSAFTGGGGTPARVVSSEPAGFVTGWWKVPAARHVLEVEKRRLVWTDDEIASEFGRVGGHRIPVGRGQRSLLISPREGLGLTRRHLREIGEFVGF